MKVTNGGSACGPIYITNLEQLRKTTYL